MKKKVPAAAALGMFFSVSQGLQAGEGLQKKPFLLGVQHLGLNIHTQPEAKAFSEAVVHGRLFIDGVEGVEMHPFRPTDFFPPPLSDENGMTHIRNLGHYFYRSQ